MRCLSRKVGTAELGRVECRCPHGLGQLDGFILLMNFSLRLISEPFISFLAPKVRYSEVRDLDAVLFGHEEISRLDIAMDHVLIVKVLETQYSVFESFPSALYCHQRNVAEVFRDLLVIALGMGRTAVSKTRSAATHKLRVVCAVHGAFQTGDDVLLDLLGYRSMQRCSNCCFHGIGVGRSILPVMELHAALRTFFTV
jgi:hypothetical protein